VLAIGAGLANSAALVSVFVVIALTIALFFFTALNIRIDGDQLHVARAHIDREFIGQIEVLTADQMKRA
jgi:hypothetical protein